MYYVFDRFGAAHPCRWIGTSPHLAGVHWKRGVRHEREITEPLEFELKPLNPDAGDHGPELPEYLKGPIPLFREDLLEAFRDAGVDNLDAYSTVVVDPDDGQRHTNYWAVNVIGAVAAVDMARSDATVHPGGPVLDVELEGFAIDETRTGGVLVFRLAENPAAMLVHESVADFLDDRGFTNLEYLDPGDVAL